MTVIVISSVLPHDSSKIFVYKVAAWNDQSLVAKPKWLGSFIRVPTLVGLVNTEISCFSSCFCKQLYDFRTLTGTTLPDQNGPLSYGNKGDSTYLRASELIIHH